MYELSRNNDLEKKYNFRELKDSDLFGLIDFYYLTLKSLTNIFFLLFR